MRKNITCSIVPVKCQKGNLMKGSLILKHSLNFLQKEFYFSDKVAGWE